MRLCRLTFGAHDALGAQILRLRRLFLRRLQRSRSTSTRRWNALSSTRWESMRLCRLTLLSPDSPRANFHLAPSAAGFSHRLRRSRSTSMRASEWIDNPRPLFRFRAQTGSHRIPPDVIQLHRELLAALVIPQTVIEISLLPDDAIGSRMKTFPISDDFAHRFIARER